MDDMAIAEKIAEIISAHELLLQKMELKNMILTKIIKEASRQRLSLDDITEIVKMVKKKFNKAGKKTFKQK